MNSRTLSIGRTGMDAYQQKLDLISNNLANLQTSGYKKVKSNFDELLRDELSGLGTPLSADIEGRNPTVGTGVKKGESYRVFEQGEINPSTNPMEIALEGPGFFGFRDARGDLFLSRSGNLSVSPMGMLVNEQGYQLDVANTGNLKDYSGEDITIDTLGRITATTKTGTVDLGKVVVYNVANKNLLQSEGRNYYTLSEGQQYYDNIANGDQREFALVHQGYTERSNANMSEEMIDMIIAQRAYQLNSKSVQTADEMWQTANNLRG